MTHVEQRVRREKAVELLRSGKSPVEVAAAVNLSKSRIYAIACLHGIACKGQRSRPVTNWALIGAIYAGGSDAEIAEELGITRQRVNQVREKMQWMGIVPPAPMPGQQSPIG